MTDQATAAAVQAAVIPPALPDPHLDALKRIGDAVFSLKNAVVASTSVSSAILLALEDMLHSGSQTGAVSVAMPPAAAPNTPAASPPAAVIATNQTSISVGISRTFKEPADALPYLAPGGTLTLDDGTYYKAFHNTVPGLVMMSASGFPRRCVMDGQHGHGGGHTMAYQKGMVHSGLPITVKRVGFVRCGGTMSTANFSNEAAIWLGDSGGLDPTPTTALWMAHIIECTFDDCANGIFTSNEPALALFALGNIFGEVSPNGMNAAAAGLDDHAAHDIYSSAGSTDVSGGSYFFGGPGHNVKTRGAKTSIQNNLVMCQDGGRVMDACEGGSVVFTGNTVWTRTDRQGVAIGQNTGAYGNSNLLEYALENSKQGVPGALLSTNTFHISRAGSTIASGNGGAIVSTGDVVNLYGGGAIVTQGPVSGLPAPIVHSDAPPPFPALPPWAAA